jgi:hypothetical protein
MPNTNEMRKVSQDALSKFRNKETKQLNEMRKKNPDNFPKMLFNEDIMDMEMHKKIIKIESRMDIIKEGEHKGISIDKRIITCDDKTILSLNGIVINKKIDQFKANVELPVNATIIMYKPEGKSYRDLIIVKE